MKQRGHSIQAASSRPAACAAGALSPGSAGNPAIRQGGKI